MRTIDSSQRVLIAGGTGFIGKHLASKCLESTPYVTCLGVRPGISGIGPEQDVEILCADLCDREALTKVISGRSFDYVLSLGGYIDHSPYFQGGRKVIETHFQGLLNLIDCLDMKSLKGFVQTGSSDEYGSAPAPQRESMRESPFSPYSLAKAAASQFIQTISRTEGFPGVVLRLFLVYGPGQDEKRFLPQIIRACLRDQEFRTSAGEQLRDFCHVDDIVKGMIGAAVSPAAHGHIINLASGIPVTIRSVVEEVVRLTGKGTPLWGAYPYRKGENMALYANIDLAGELIGWEPGVSLAEGLIQTIDSYRNNI